MVASTSSSSEDRPLLPNHDPGNTTGLSITTATIVVVGGIFGTGIFTMPHCIAISGLTGIFIYIFMLIIAGYGGINLSKCWVLVMELKPEYKGQVRNPYPVMACVCYGTIFGKIFGVLLNIINFSGALVMVLLGSETFRLMKDFVDLSICEWLLIAGVCLMPLTWFGTPKHLCSRSLQFNYVTNCSARLDMSACSAIHLVLHILGRGKLFYYSLFVILENSNLKEQSGWAMGKIKSWEKVLLLFIIIFGIVAAAVVTYNAVQVIVSEETFILPCYLRPFI
ncbi:hypothetical protein GQR58_017366 [Nymphon striatum]|nr:hypothetical protein GQR58_017366 [Nymphon striatum]